MQLRKRAATRQLEASAQAQLGCSFKQPRHELQYMNVHIIGVRGENQGTARSSLPRRSATQKNCVYSILGLHHMDFKKTVVVPGFQENRCGFCRGAPNALGIMDDMSI